MLFGFINANKPPGMSSRDLVNVVQRRLKGLRNPDGSKVKVGHAGTLDPLAEGVLVLGVGPAVRLVTYLQEQSKRYRGTFLLGQSSVSGDLEGPVELHPDLPMPDRESLESAARNLTGTITQTPPAHSAIWIDGKRAHERIRAGEEVDMPSRQVRVDSLEITRYAPPEFEVDVVCGSGTYIRTIGLDLAIAAGSVSVMSHLQRTEIGRFRIEQAVALERLRVDDLAPLLLPPSWATEHMAQIPIDDDRSVRLGNGLSIDGQVTGDNVSGDPHIDSKATSKEFAAVLPDGRLRAIVYRRQNAWYPRRVFPIAQQLPSGTRAPV